MASKLIFVTGYFGSPIEETARKLADSENLTFLSLDREIEARDGRSVSRISMMMGEHGYRNAEYELLEEISQNHRKFTGDSAGLVVACGDGVLYDDMSREIIRSAKLLITGREMTTDQLWENARKQQDTYHAFMKFGSDEEKRAKFNEFISRQQELFAVL